MPTPNQQESRDEFVRRCIPIVLDEGTANNQDQAVAICHSLWDESRKHEEDDMDKHAKLAQLVRGRRYSGGITTAEHYVEQMLALKNAGADVDLPAQPETLLKAAALQLVYSNKDLVTDAVSRDANDVVPSNCVLPPNTLLVIQHKLTSSRKDRDGDVLETAGAKLDPKAPLLWQHQHFMPVGKVLTTVEHTSDVLRVVSVVLDLKDSLTDDIATLVEADVLRFSHGFKALDYMPLETDDGDDDEGFRVTSFAIVEASLVSVPSNVDAEIELFARGKLHSPVVKARAKALHDSRDVVATGVDLKSYSGPAGEPSESLPPVAKHVNAYWVKSTDEFRPEHQRLHAAYPTHEWASNWLETPVKQLRISTTFVPLHAMGNFLSAVDALTDGCELVDARNITGSSKELPVVRKTIQLNSTATGEFIVDGMLFFREATGQKTVLEMETVYQGMLIKRYDGDGRGPEFIKSCWQWAKENNYMRREAFVYNGKFLPRTGPAYDELFLESHVNDAVMRAIDMVNMGDTFGKRGMIFLGPPGTGKTLSAKALLRHTTATFIWATAKGMQYTSDISSVFDLAAELAPAIVCFEDIESFYSDYAFDLLRTEMDGLENRDGILTLLTTNYPELLPKAIIDRPGRFHDVLQFRLPDQSIRKKMLQAWYSDISDEIRDAVAKKTFGYSGAHLRELCDFASVLSDEDKLTRPEAILKALDKIRRQRELIGGLHQQSHHRPKRRSAKRGKMPAKSGRVLSSANYKLIANVANALNDNATALNGVLEAATPSDAADAKSTSAVSARNPAQDIVLADVVNFILGADDEALRRIRRTTEAIDEVSRSRDKARAYRALVGRNHKE